MLSRIAFVVAAPALTAPALTSTLVYGLKLSLHYKLSSSPTSVISDVSLGNQDDATEPDQSKSINKVDAVFVAQQKWLADKVAAEIGRPDAKFWNELEEIKKNSANLDEVKKTLLVLGQKTERRMVAESCVAESRNAQDDPRPRDVASQSIAAQEASIMEAELLEEIFLQNIKDYTLKKDDSESARQQLIQKLVKETRNDKKMVDLVKSFFGLVDYFKPFVYKNFADSAGLTWRGQFKVPEDWKEKVAAKMSIEEEEEDHHQKVGTYEYPIDRELVKKHLGTEINELVATLIVNSSRK